MAHNVVGKLQEMTSGLMFLYISSEFSGSEGSK